MALSARWQAGMNRLFNASSRAGETLKGTLVGIIETAGRVLEALDGWMQRNPGLASALMHTASAVAAIVTGMGALALGLAAVIGPFAMLKIGLGIIAPLFAAISAPALIAVGAIAAVGTAGVLLWQNWDTVKAKLASSWDSITASLGAFESSAAAALLRFSTSVTTLWQDVRASTSSALDWLGTLPARFAAAGREMLRGLAEGIASGLGEAKAAIVSAGAAVIDGFKGTLGIRSPSRVFAQLGAHMMSGLSQGLADHEQDPTRTLKAAAQRLAAAAAVPLATIAAPAFAQAPPEIPPAVSESVQRLASMLSSIATPPNYNEPTRLAAAAAVPLATIAAPAFAQAPPEIPPAVSESVQRLASMLSSIATPPNYNEPTRLAAPLKPAAAPAQHQQPQLTYHINIDARGAADSSALRAAVRDELEAHRRQLEARRRRILGDVD